MTASSSPSLDSVYDLSGDACAFVAEETHPRIDPTMVARFDSHNDMADLLLDIKEVVDKAGDEKSRAVILRRLRRALGRRRRRPDANRRRPRSPARRGAAAAWTRAEPRPKLIWNVSAFVKYSFQ